MSSVDLSTGALWQTLSKDVYTQGRMEKGDPPDIVSEIQGSLTESHPLLDTKSKDDLVKKKKGMHFLLYSYHVLFILPLS
ncbi:hypothetical protein TNCT_439111 [Trichonephila clavata]|uniref:Uncharacterized protein n=1 Tax=Trichonephila clavata TaxID=2740835 RepID=A0A8X6HAW7_TRICU|nr:hypothetical protein TNCT_439111 [Trichonephila clavata]